MTNPFCVIFNSPCKSKYSLNEYPETNPPVTPWSVLIGIMFVTDFAAEVMAQIKG